MSGENDPMEAEGQRGDEEREDDYVDRAKPEILDVILQQRLVTDREIKVRLERSFFPWVVDRAIKRLRAEGKVRNVGDKGRKRKGAPELFYTLNEIQYDSIIGILNRKKRVSFEVNSVLTKYSPAGTHAEDLFEEALRSLGFEIKGRDVSEYKGRKAKGVFGKQLPNLDFVVARDRIAYGIDVKNWIRYEYTTRYEVASKVSVALELGLIPFILARYVSKDAMFNEVIQKGGLCYPYKTLLLSSTYESLATEAGGLLGYPIIAVDVLPAHKAAKVDELHEY